jgi:hypothetical protein
MLRVVRLGRPANDSSGTGLAVPVRLPAKALTVLVLPTGG